MVGARSKHGGEPAPTGLPLRGQVSRNDAGRETLFGTLFERGGFLNEADWI